MSNLRGSQLKINISSELLRSLRVLSMKSGLSVEDYVQELIASALYGDKEKSKIRDRIRIPHEMIQRPLEDQVSFGNSERIKGLEEKRFTDEGAKAYTQAARYEFQKYSARKGIELEKALEQLTDISSRYQGDIEFIRTILMGKHELTGDEMLKAVEATGNCPMMKTLQEWTGDPLPALSKVFVDAIEI